VLLCLFLLHQMRVRPSTWQGFPAVVMSVPLGVYAFTQVTTLFPIPAVLWGARALIAICLAAVTVVASPRVGGVFDRHLVSLGTERARLIRLAPEQAPYADLIRYIREHTAENDLIYSGVVDHSRLFINDSLLYFLTNR